MGDRAQVLIKDTGVYLYTHWGGSQIIEVVKAAMAKRWRWDDPCYLARIIFCEMVKGSIDGGTGYGIDTEEHGDIKRLVTIDCEKKQVLLVHLYGDKETRSWTFEEFVL